MAQKPTAKAALAFTPKQKVGVRYDIPTAKQIESCTVESAQENFGQPGWVVRDNSGRLLRKFVDTGGRGGKPDKALDQWSYYKDGIEVYRDIDSNFDNKTDQYRWFGPNGGTRWGIDTDQNGKIDSWKQISASEVAEELFYAIRERDDTRFRNLLVTGDELKAMQLGEKFEKLVTEKIRTAGAKFRNFAGQQRKINANSKWSQFSATQPIVVPAGTQGLKRDIMIYNLATGMYENGKSLEQVALGTIIQVAPNKWRIMEQPEFIVSDAVVANGNLFFPTPEAPAAGANPIAQPPTVVTKLFAELDAVEKKLASARDDAAKNRLEKERGNILLQLALKTKEKTDRVNWVQQMTDTVCNAYTSETYLDGLKFLDSTIPQLERAKLQEALPYMEMGIINARFSHAHAKLPSRQRQRANEKYNTDLEKFVKKYPRGKQTADALLQLGLTADLAGDDPEIAAEWYKKCRDGFPNTIQGKRAGGALARIEGIGRPFALTAQQLSGKPFDLQSRNLRGKVIVIHFWETDCKPCIEGFEELQRVQSKYKDDLLVIGANLDTDKATVRNFLAKNRNVNWPQLHSPGGVNKSALAIKLGIATLPLTTLIDQDGNLAEGNIHVDEIEREVQRLLKKNRSADRSARPRR